MEFVVYGGTASSSPARLVTIECKLSRPNVTMTGATVTKYDDQNLYTTFNWYYNHAKTITIQKNGFISAPSASIDTLASTTASTTNQTVSSALTLGSSTTSKYYQYNSTGLTYKPTGNSGETLYSPIDDQVRYYDSGQVT
jgi:hypothetical protein